MSFHAGITLAVVIVTVGLQALDKVSASIGFMGAVTVLLLFGVLTPTEAFSGFGNAAPMTVAALYVCARAVEKAGVLQRLVPRILGARDQGRWTLARLCVPLLCHAGFINNTPLVALAAPQVSDWARKRGVSPSRFLMPLSYATILGGVVTTIGTSTNLVVSGLLERDSGVPMAMFEITRVGLPVALAGGALLVWLTPLLLPERRAASEQLQEDAREFVVAMRVVPGGPLDGVQIGQGGLRNLQGVFLFQLERNGEVHAPLAPTMALRGDDVVAFAGRVDTIVDLQRMPGLVSIEAKHLAVAGQHVVMEAVVGWRSPLRGKTLREVEFRGRYQAAVVAIHREGSRIHAKLGTVRLQPGDTLLLLTDPGFAERWKGRRDFLLVAPIDAQLAASRGLTTRVAVVGVIAVGLAASGVLPLLHAALVGALGFVLVRAITAGEALEAVDVDVFVMIAASFGLALAMEKTGLASLLAERLVAIFSSVGHQAGPLIGIVLATSVVTELLTNNAAAAVMFPIAVATAQSVGLDVRATAIAVAVVSSASFLTPIGYQTNMMVYGPGGYRFLDYTRLGIPLTIASLTLTVWLTLSR